MYVCHAGMGGHYVLDEYGDRDVNFSIIYTSALTEKVVYCYFFQFAFILFRLGQAHNKPWKRVMTPT